MKKIFRKFASSVPALILPSVALAQQQAQQQTLADKMKQRIQFLGLDLRGGNPTDSPESIIGAVLGTLFTFLAVIFFILIVWSGIQWMTAGGNEDKVRRAKNLIIASVIGMGIVLTSYLITVFVISLFRGQ